MLGSLTFVALLLMGVFAGVAHASSVTNVSVTNTSPSNAASARTVYSIGFHTSSTGGLSTAQNSTITITFPSGTGLSNVNSSEILTANNTNIGSCSLSQANLTATCQFFSNETVAAGAALTVQLGGVANTTGVGSQTLSVQTTSDTTLATGTFAVVANNLITQLSVTNASPTDAASGRTVYSVTFDTSSTGGMSTLANSAITIMFPSGTSLSNVNSSEILTANNTNIGSCSLSQANLTATCGLFANETVAAGSALTIQLGGVTNPPVNPTGGGYPIHVETTSDITPVTTQFPDVANNPITKLSVTNSTPTDAAAGQTVYSITFDTSTTGAMSTLANSAITIMFPSGTSLSNVNSSEILTANNTNIGSCSLSEANLTATCGFFANETVAAGSPLTVQLGGVVNPPVNPTGLPTQSLQVQTTSDPTPVSGSFPVVANNPFTKLSVTNASPTEAAGGRTVYSITFDTSGTGAMSTLANSSITITFPSGTSLSNVNSSQILTANNTNIGSCSLSQANLTATCGFFANETVAAGSPLTVQLGGVANTTTTGSPNISVQTTSDPTPVSARFPVVSNNPVTNVSVTNTAPTDAAGGRTVYSIGFTTSSTGAMSTLANSSITVTFPSGTGLGNVDSSEILTANNTNIGSCSLSQANLTATCGFFANETVAAGTLLTIQLGGVTNTTNTGSQTLSVQTTSDPTPVNGSFPVVANNLVSQPSVALSNTTPGATGVTYAVAFNTSSTGALSTLANSSITITFPSGTSLSSVNSSQILTANSTNIGSCSLSQANLTATCGFFANETVAAGASLTVELGGVGNPSTAGRDTLSVATTSDPAPVTSGQYAIGSAPAVAGVSPASGPTSGVTVVMITGTNFTNVTAVSFGTAGASTFTVNSGTSISATAPAGSAGTVDVTVTTPGGTSATTAADQYTYVAAPTVTGVNPTAGPTSAGTSVTITGTNLTGATAVDFGITAATNVTVVTPRRSPPPPPPATPTPST